METANYVSLSGQLALDRRLSTIAQNIANARTAGYKAAGVNFQSIISNVMAVPTAFSSAGQNHVSEVSGGFTKTGNPLDVAIQGSAFMAMQGPNGTYYSRDGRLSLTPDGQIVNTSGHPVLDAGGAPAQINPAEGDVNISRDGFIYQNGRRQAGLGLFALDLSAGHTRVENAGFVTAKEPELVTDFTTNGFAQGYVEESNVNPVSEMVRLIQVQRAFESVSTLSEKAQEAERNAIQVLGGKG